MLALGSGYALYAVLDAIVDQYLPVVTGFQDELETLEQRIFSKRFRRSTIVELYELKRELTRMRFAVAPLQDVISTLLHVHDARIPDPVKPYLRDVSDHLLRVNDGIDTMREMLGAALNVNLSLVTLNQGEVVKRLAGWAALLSVPTLVASWYGMNFEHMPELHDPHAYALLAVGVLLVMVGLFVYLKRIRWL
jgi:magnesium transporter